MIIHNLSFNDHLILFQGLGNVPTHLQVKVKSREHVTVCIQHSYVSYLTVISFPNFLGPPDWLVELHGKLWGQANLENEIIRTVRLDGSGFPELQNSITTSADVLEVKSKFLRSKESVPEGDGIEVAAWPADNASLDNEASPDGEACPEASPDGPDGEAGSDDDASFVAPMLFPCKMRYLDLTQLGLKYSQPRMPQLMLIRSEWSSMMSYITAARKGAQGSIVFTGQPGIGLYFYFSSLVILSKFQRKDVLSVLQSCPSPHWETAHCVPRHVWVCLLYR